MGNSAVRGAGTGARITVLRPASAREDGSRADLVKSGTTSLIDFDLSALPAGSSVNKATLRLFVDAVFKFGTFDVYPANGAWVENTLASALGASATGRNPIATSSNSPASYWWMSLCSRRAGSTDKRRSALSSHLFTPSVRLLSGRHENYGIIFGYGLHNVSETRHALMCGVPASRSAYAP